MAKYDEDKLYIVIDDEYRGLFEDEVCKWLQNGYLPLGGVSNYVDKYGNVHFCQALMKPTSNED